MGLIYYCSLHQVNFFLLLKFNVDFKILFYFLVAYIYSRSLVTYYTSISPPGGNFKEGIYISEYKIFAYYCDDTRFG